MANMSNVQPPMILSLQKSTIMVNYGHSSRDALELMAVIYTFPHLLLSRVFIEIEKAFFHRIVFLYAISTCFSPTSLRVGRVLQQMSGSGLMHWPKVFQCLQDFIILQMQGILIARNFLFLSGVFSIIFRSGVLQVFGIVYFLSKVFTII